VESVLRRDHPAIGLPCRRGWTALPPRALCVGRPPASRAHYAAPSPRWPVRSYLRMTSHITGPHQGCLFTCAHPPQPSASERYVPQVASSLRGVLFSACATDICRVPSVRPGEGLPHPHRAIPTSAATIGDRQLEGGWSLESAAPCASPPRQGDAADNRASRHSARARRQPCRASYLVAFRDE
jgi:hypothetical protein